MRKTTKPFWLMAWKIAGLLLARFAATADEGEEEATTRWMTR